MAYCTKCGTLLDEDDDFCAQCGAPRKTGKGASPGDRRPDPDRPDEPVLSPDPRWKRRKSRRNQPPEPDQPSGSVQGQPEPGQERPTEEPAQEPKADEPDLPPKKKRRLKRGCLITLLVLGLLGLVLTGAAWAYVRAELLKTGNPHLMIEDAVGRPYAGWLVTLLMLPRPIEFSKPDDPINDDLAFIGRYWSEDATDTAESGDATAAVTGARGTSDGTAAAGAGAGAGETATASSEADYRRLVAHYSALWRLHKAIGIKDPSVPNGGYGFAYEDYYRRVGRGPDSERVALVDRCRELMDKVVAKRAGLEGAALQPSYEAQHTALLKLYGHLKKRTQASLEAAQDVVGSSGCRLCRGVVAEEDAERKAFERAYASAKPKKL